MILLLSVAQLELLGVIQLAGGLVWRAHGGITHMSCTLTRVAARLGLVETDYQSALMTI